MKKTPESVIISGPMDVDRLDYLVRDSYFTGAMYGIIDTKRIIRLSAFIEGKLAVNVRGLGAIEELAIARLQSFLNIYFHHATRAAQQLLLNAMELLEGELDFTSMSVDEYLEYDDFTVWSLLKNNPRTREIVRRIERRRLPKRVYETRIVGEEQQLLSLLKDKELQESLAGRIASEAGVDAGLVWIDTPYIPPLLTDEATQVTFFTEEKGERRIVEVNSPFLRQVREAYNIVRVYTDSGERERVAEASAKILGRGRIA